MKTVSTVKFIQLARKAGLNMREVSERLDASAGQAGGIRKWQGWIRSEIAKKNGTVHA